MQGDQRKNTPLPKKVTCYSIAGSVSKEINSNVTELLGDNMVRIKSALVQHKNASKNLKFKKENTWITYENNDLDLPSR